MAREEQVESQTTRNWRLLWQARVSLVIRRHRAERAPRGTGRIARLAEWGGAQWLSAVYGGEAGRVIGTDRRTEFSRRMHFRPR
jgi:hypothetical protein